MLLEEFGLNVLALTVGLRLLVAEVVIVMFVLAGEHIAVSKVVLFVASGGSQARPNVLANWQPLALSVWRPPLGRVVMRDWRSLSECLAGKRGGISASTVVGLALGLLT